MALQGNSLNSSSYKKSKIVSLAVIAVLIFNLALLYYLKYANHNLSLTEFSLFKFGNLLNLFFIIIILVGLFTSIQKNKILSPPHLIIYTLLSTIFLIFGAVMDLIQFPLSSSYIFDHPFDKVLKGAFYFLHQFILIMFLSVIWLRLFKDKKFVFLRAVRNAFFIVIFLFLFSYAFLHLRNVEGSSMINKDNRVSIAVVLGAAVWSNNIPSPSLAARVDKAAELFQKKIVNKIQLTGSNAPGELSEARVAYNHLANIDITDDDVWIEEQTTSTAEQVQFIKSNLLSGKKNHKVVIVSDSYHLGRVKEICAFYNIDADVVPSDLKLSTKNKLYYKIRESTALLVFWFFAI
jgi:vancomycin permeability regulator SanA